MVPSTTILILFYNTHHQKFIFPNFKCVIAVSYCISILNKNLPFLDLYYKTQLVGALYAIYSNNSGPLLYFWDESHKKKTEILVKFLIWSWVGTWNFYAPILVPKKSPLKNRICIDVYFYSSEWKYNENELLITYILHYSFVLYTLKIRILFWWYFKKLINELFPN